MMAGNDIDVDGEQFHEAFAGCWCCCSRPVHGQSIEEDAEDLEVAR